ncbi:uncharacterized protein LY79DRAFT_13386 [Colletotrichum navitas]|uniref:Uncharacterized protein n=1 Tax=Colletotrichum navitas TaxID=681940 RepID=A0AAD8QCT8_9PEZI|nr:uncharacterized protein LY79DRAFT_13386 [Colletotrichum navitas]KAK1600292.1 hypothetical protein LY79DRAFT_13386 [Colletotrichum navitas]
MLLEAKQRSPSAEAGEGKRTPALLESSYPGFPADWAGHHRPKVQEERAGGGEGICFFTWARFKNWGKEGGGNERRPRGNLAGHNVRGARQSTGFRNGTDFGLCGHAAGLEIRGVYKPPVSGPRSSCEPQTARVVKLLWLGHLEISTCTNQPQPVQQRVRFAEGRAPRSDNKFKSWGERVD